MNKLQKKSITYNTLLRAFNHNNHNNTYLPSKTTIKNYLYKNLQKNKTNFTKFRMKKYKKVCLNSTHLTSKYNKL